MHTYGNKYAVIHCNLHSGSTQNGAGTINEHKTLWYDPRKLSLNKGCMVPCLTSTYS